MTAPLAAAGPSAYWYLARATGVVSLLLLTLSVVLGVLGSLRFAAVPRWPRFTVDTLHRDVSMLVLAFLALHILTSVIDAFAPINFIDAVIPFSSAYRPLWMGLGAASFDLLLALVATSLVRRRLGYRRWRAIHWLAYASWPVAVLHGLGTGSDTKQGWMLALTFACAAAVLIAALVRIARANPERSWVRGTAFSAALLTPAGLAIFTLAGPLEHGWARRAGTPASLLGRAPGQGSTTAVAAQRPSSQALRAPFSARVSGRISQTPEPGGAVIDLALRVVGSVRGELRVRMAGAPLGAGGLSLTGSQVDFTALGQPSVLEGKITSLQGQQFVARVSDGSGPALDLQADLNIDGQTGDVSGQLAGNPLGGRR